MEDLLKSPARCITAKFGEDGTGAFALLSCAAWRDLSALDHRVFDIGRMDTCVYPFGPDSKVDEMIERIGEKCASVCSNCDRFTPNPTQQIVGVAPYALPVYAEGSQGVIGEATFAPAESEPLPPIQSGTN